MPHWIHAAESLYMGYAGQLYSAGAGGLIEFRLDGRSVLEWGKTCSVSEIYLVGVIKWPSARRF